jgi:hypothetical protein
VRIALVFPLALTARARTAGADDGATSSTVEHAGVRVAVVSIDLRKARLEQREAEPVGGDRPHRAARQASRRSR